MNEMLEEFSSLSKFCGTVAVTMVSANGREEMAVDTGGVFRDGLTEFWSDFYDRCTAGKEYKVPVVREDFDKAKWQAVAKVIHTGWLQTKYFPLQMARPVMETVILGVAQGDLIDCFLLYVSESDRKILEQAMASFEDVDKDELLSVLSDYECKRIPRNREQLMDDLNGISHMIFIQMPKFISDAWREVLEDVMTEKDLDTIYDKCTPTSKNVLQLLSREITSTEESTRALNFLKRFVKDSDSR